MKKLLALIFIVLIIIGLYQIYTRIADAYIENAKNRITDIDKAKEETSRINANLYIKAVEISLASSFSTHPIQDGTYFVKKDKIVHVDDSNLFYSISYKGTFPTSESRITIENNQVVSAMIYINGYQIEYLNHTEGKTL